LSKSNGDHSAIQPERIAADGDTAVGAAQRGVTDRDRVPACDEVTRLTEIVARLNQEDREMHDVAPNGESPHVAGKRL
jgi:hypothetical protein